MAEYTDEQIAGFRKSIGVVSAGLSVLRSDLNEVHGYLTDNGDLDILPHLENAMQIADLFESAVNSELITPELTDIPVVSLTDDDQPMLDFGESDEA